MSDVRDDPGFTVHDRRWWTGEPADSTEPAERKPTYVEQLERQLADHRQRLHEAQQTVRAAHEEVTREIDAARARIERDAARDVARSRGDLLRSFLPVLDDVDRALAAITDADPAIRQGLELIQRSFLARLAEHGVQRLDPLDQPFDPRLHDALAAVPATRPEQDGQVAAVIAPGYLLGDEVLRPAQVAVARRRPL